MFIIVWLSGGHSFPLFPFAQITIELASDSRDFSTALAKTRLAEMTNPKMVAIPQHKLQPKLEQRGPQAESQGASQSYPRGLTSCKNIYYKYVFIASLCNCDDKYI